MQTPSPDPAPPPVTLETATITPPAAEPGWSSTEFWMGVVGALVVLLGPHLGWSVSPSEQAALVTLIVSAYAIARGIRKHGTAG